MHFMLVTLVFLICAVLWGFFHSNPTGVDRRSLLLLNVLVIVLALAAGSVIGVLLYGDAVAVKAGEKGLATYLAIMAAGTSFLVVVAVGGMIRNLVIFPPSRRAAAEGGAPKP